MDDNEQEERRVVVLPTRRAVIERDTLPKMQDRILKRKAANTLAALEYVKPEDIREIVVAMMDKAKAGNVTAFRELREFMLLYPRFADMLATKTEEGNFEIQIKTVG